jgi:hypothetical protein
MCFWTVSIVLDSIKIGYHDVSETGSVPGLRCIKLELELEFYTPEDGGKASLRNVVICKFYGI